MIGYKKYKKNTQEKDMHPLTVRHNEMTTLVIKLENS